MGVKQLLGLEACDISEEEIMRRLQEASRREFPHVEFRNGGQVVRIKVHGVDPAGIMREEGMYYAR